MYKFLGGMGAALVIVMLFLGIRSVAGVQVNYGHVGVVSNFGHVDPHQTPLQPGWVSVNPFNGTEVIAVNTQPQTYRFPEVQAAGSDGQAIYVDVLVQYQINSSGATQVVVNGGADHLIATILGPRVQDFTKEAMPNYSIVPNSNVYVLHFRQQIRDALQVRLAKGMDAYGITIPPDGVQLPNIHADKAFDAAVEATAVSQQKQQQAVNDAQAKVAEAQGTATANALLQQSLTPGVLQQHFIDKWNGALPTYMGAGADPFINLTK